MLNRIVSYIVMVCLSVSTVLWNVDGVAQTVAGASQIYKYAKSGNVTALRSIQAQGQSLDAVDQYGNTALCRSVWMKDYYAFSILKQGGASVSSPCISKIPAEKIQEFNTAYTQWTKGVNAGQIAYGSPHASTTAKSGAVAKTATARSATPKIATETGLSTGAKVAIGVGAVAVVGGAIALAAGGGGGGSGGSDDDDEIDPDAGLCEGVNCGSHGTCSPYTGMCVCADGYTGANCQVAPEEPKTCPNNCSGNGTCNTNTGVCSCNTGWGGTDCSIKDGGVPSENMNCGSHGVFNAAARKCICSDGYTGQRCQIAPCQGSYCSIAREVGTMAPDNGPQNRVLLLSDGERLEHKDELTIENIGTMNNTPYWMQPGKNVSISQWITKIEVDASDSPLEWALGMFVEENGLQNVALGDTGYFLFDFFSGRG